MNSRLVLLRRARAYRVRVRKRLHFGLWRRAYVRLQQIRRAEAAARLVVSDDHYRAYLTRDMTDAIKDGNERQYDWCKGELQKLEADIAFRHRLERFNFGG